MQIINENPTPSVNSNGPHWNVIEFDDNCEALWEHNKNRRFVNAFSGAKIKLI